MDTPVGRATKASQWRYPYPPDPTDEQRATVVVSRLGFKAGAAWSRTDALHDPTDTEIREAGIAIAARVHNEPTARIARVFDALDSAGYYTDQARAALAVFLTGRRAEG